MINFLSGVAITAAAFLAYLHFTRGAMPASNGLVDSILAGFRSVVGEAVTAFVAEVQKLPALISAEVAVLKDQLTAALQRAQTAEANLAKEIAARGAILTDVQTKLSAAIATGLAPASALSGAVAEAQPEPAPEPAAEPAAVAAPAAAAPVAPAAAEQEA